MSETTLTVGLLQHACPVGASRDDHLDRAEALAADAAGRGAELLVTQELFASHYFPQVEDEARFDLAEPVPGPTTERLRGWATRWGAHVHGSLFERRAAGVYHNTSVLIDPAGELVGTYRKMHVPDDPRFYEKYYFTPGDLGFRSFAVHGGGRSATVGSLVCWDQWFPEAARLTAMGGAEALLYPTAIGWHDSETPEARSQQHDAWRTVQRSHAIANGVFVAAVNRVGVEDELTFWGRSFVADPGGVVIAEASGDADEALVVTLDLSKVEAYRRGWPFLRDRRVDAYGPLTERLLR